MLSQVILDCLLIEDFHLRQGRCPLWMAGGAPGRGVLINHMVVSLPSLVSLLISSSSLTPGSCLSCFAVFCQIALIVIVHLSSVVLLRLQCLLLQVVFLYLVEVSGTHVLFSASAVLASLQTL